MKKSWGILLLGLAFGAGVYANSTDDWKHIVQVAKEVTADKEVQQAIFDAMIASQKVVSLYTKKMVAQVTPEEKEKIINLVDIAKKMSDIYCTMLKNNEFDNVDQEKMEELRELAQEFMNSMLPCMILMQDPAFANEQKISLQNNYRQFCTLMQQMLAQIQNDLKQ